MSNLGETKTAFLSVTGEIQDEVNKILLELLES